MTAEARFKFIDDLSYLRVNNPFKAAPKYLIPDTETRLNHVTLQGMTEASREALRKNLSLSNARLGLIAYARSGEGMRKYLGEEWIFQTTRDVADRRVNSLIEALSDKNSESGRTIETARESPANADHGAPHFRREQEYFDAATGSDSRLRHEKTILPWVHSIYLSFFTHDLDQLLNMQRNIEEGRIGTDREIVVKAGHGPGGSSLALIFAELYERVSKFEPGTEQLLQLDRLMPKGTEAEELTLAEFIAFGTAVMQLDHDHMDIYDQAIRGSAKAYTLGSNGEKIPLDDENLFLLYKEHRLDKFSLSFSDILRLTRIEKQKRGCELSSDPYDLGIHPLIQREYGDQIIRLMGKDIRPFDHFNQAQREQFISSAEMKVWTDDLEKNSPSFESVTRTTLTQYSQERPWWNEMDPGILLEGIKNWDGEPDSNLNFDAMRILWEIYHQGDPLQSVSIKGNEYIQSISRDAILMRAIAVREFGVNIMNGNTDFVEDIYRDRISKLQEKALDKAKYKAKSIRLIMQEASVYDPIDQNSIGYVTQRIGGRDTGLAMRFQAIAHNLIEESQAVISGFKCKPDTVGDKKKSLEDNPQIKIYSQREIENFIYVVNEVIAHVSLEKGVCTQSEIDTWRNSGYQAVPDKLKVYEAQVATREFPDKTPFFSYDQLSGPEGRRMVYPLVQSIQV